LTIGYVLLAVIGAGVAIWLIWRAAINSLRRFIRNLWPH
jgi:hypothetical protein